MIDELCQNISNVLEIFDASDEALLKQSYQAFVNYNNTHQCDSNRTASILNGIIVTDSESDDPDQYIALDICQVPRHKLLLKKREKPYVAEHSILLARQLLTVTFCKEREALIAKQSLRNSLL